VPFDGVLAKVSVKKLDTIGSGTSVATLITTQKVAEISLNEVDVSKVKVGQKATLTFDAIPDLTITGLVAEIDSIGTVSQGVVTYNVKITFDTQDDRIKPGMSISSSIITDVRQDVLVVANSAIKLQNNTSYVEIFDPALVGSDSSQGVVSPIAPIKQTVETGLSNDTETEIVSGLKEKDQAG
jgi:HlyD family secretion protein